MLNVGALREGYVLDHIKAGKAMTIYHDLKLDKLDCTVAIIKNARSQKMGKKDIIKVECPIEDLDLDILGRKDRCKERAEAAEAGCERDQMQESSLHYFHRAGTGSDFCSCR